MKQPVFAPGALVASGAVVCGDVTVGENCNIWFHATVRGDMAPISLGADTNIQDNCVLHVDTDDPLRVGDGVTVGHGVILHGCTVGKNSLIGMGSIVMNGAVIGRDCIIGAGSLVTQDAVIPDGSMAFGRPARVVRPLTEEEKQSNRTSARDYVAEAQGYARAGLFSAPGEN